jgi:hypothetical protein
MLTKSNGSGGQIDPRQDSKSARGQLNIKIVIGDTIVTDEGR